MEDDVRDSSPVRQYMMGMRGYIHLAAVFLAKKCIGNSIKVQQISYNFRSGESVSIKQLAKSAMSTININLLTLHQPCQK